MNTGGTITACAVVGALSMLGVQTATHGDVGWKELLGSGTAGMMIFVVVLFLRSISEMRKEHGETVAKISADFGESVRSATKEFADSTQKIIEGSRAHNQANLGMLQQMMRDLHEKR
jgi:hypothetical protein